MKKNILFVLTVLALFITVSTTSVYAANKAADVPTSPTTNNGKKWRIGYYEGGQYADYQMILKVILNGLQDLGWLTVDYPKEHMDHKEFWEWLSNNVQSEYLDFVEDAYFAPGDFDKALRAKTQEEYLQRVKEKDDLDFIFALGTWAGQDLSNDKHDVPTMVASCSDPLASKIVASPEDSGFDHLHAKVEPDRYERQVRLFHDIVGFQRLGVVYEDSEEGRTFAAIKDIETVAKERNFEIVKCFAPFNNVSQQQSEDAVVQCYEEIAPKVDAVYITVHRGVNLNNLPKLLEPLYEQKLPTFSMLGSNEVRHGVLMSIAQAGFKYVGKFHAEVMAKVFNGAKPRDISQIWTAPPKIDMNLKVSEIIGYNAPVDIMMASDEIYEEIEK